LRNLVEEEETKHARSEGANRNRKTFQLLRDLNVARMLLRGAGADHDLQDEVTAVMRVVVRGSKIQYCVQSRAA
jgi:hypothetical protein